MDKHGLVLIRGGGDLASGVGLRVKRAGFSVMITELEKPLAVRRTVSLCQAVYDKKIQLEEITACLVNSPQEALLNLEKGIIPVMIDPDASIRKILTPMVLVDARMTKQKPDLNCEAAPFVIGLGPGFEAGKDCHAVVETKRGHYLGRVYWTGSAEKDSRLPEAVGERGGERVLRSPTDGVLKNILDIGADVNTGEIICKVSGQPVVAPFPGMIRGLLHDGLSVQKGLKIGDVDPRRDKKMIHMVSDKSLAIGGGVLEAILTYLNRS